MRVCPKTRNDWAVFKRRGRTFLWGKQPQVRPGPCRATWRFNMNMIKSLVLGSAAGLIALSGAQAADLPVKAKAVEYVRICSLYGAGFYYIPGTDTCIKIGGFVRTELNFNAGGSFSFLNGNLDDPNRNDVLWRSRAVVTFDVRSQTEYGTLRSYMAGGYQWDNGAGSGVQGNVAGTAP